MKKCIITAETTCDLPAEILNERNFKTIPITIVMGLEEKKDGLEIKAEELFEFVKETGSLPKTAAVSREEYKEFFTMYFNNKSTSNNESNVGLNVAALDLSLFNVLIRFFNNEWSEVFLFVFKSYDGEVYASSIPILFKELNDISAGPEDV